MLRRTALVWTALAILIAVPVGLAVMSPLLQWRSPVYVAAGFAGVAAMILVLLQPLLAAGTLPGISILSGRHIHRWVGITLVFAVVFHVAGLWITSPPDVIDALLFRSPTPFSVWGVLAMWCVFVSAAIAVTRRKLRLHPKTWKIAHKSLAMVIVGGSVLHALLIDGTMETVSKVILCIALVLATVLALAPSLLPAIFKMSK